MYLFTGRNVKKKRDFYSENGRFVIFATLVDPRDTSASPVYFLLPTGMGEW